MPARYVRTNVSFPIGKLTKWVGVNDPMSALEYVSTGAKVKGYYTEGGGINRVVMEHVYVEAYVPYTNYRGTGEDDSGKGWVPMDPSFKQDRVLNEGSNIWSEMGLTWKQLTDDYLSEFRNITPRVYYEERVNQYLATTHPGQTIETLKRKTEIKTMQFDFLPNTLPYAVQELIERFAEVPAAQRNMVQFNIPGYLEYTTSVPELAGRRVTLTFAPETADDQAVIDKFGTIFNTPPYAIRLKPQLRINGEVKAEGKAGQGGLETGYTFSFIPAGGWPAHTVSHTIMFGSYNAEGITVGNVRPEMASVAKVEESAEPYIAKMVHSLAMKYHDSENRMRKTLNDTMKLKSQTYFTEAQVFTRHSTGSNPWGIATSFNLTGYMIDATDTVGRVGMVDGNVESIGTVDYAMLSGYEASYQENATFEDSMFWVSGLSAVKSFAVLKAMGIPILDLDPYTTFRSPGLPDEVIADINNALNMGQRVMTPRTSGGLPVAPYIKYNPETGYAGFMIADLAGGFNEHFAISAELSDSISNWISNSSPGIDLMGITFASIFPETGHTVALGDGFTLGLKMLLRWKQGSNEWTEEKNDPNFWMLIQTGRWQVTSTGLPLPWWNPGHYNINYNGNPIFDFNVWGVKITEIKTPCDNSNIQNTCNHSFTAWSFNGGLGDTISIKAEALGDTNSQIQWTCRSAPGAIDGGTCQSTTMLNGTNFLFNPNPPAVAAGRTGPLSYEITASITYNGVVAKDMVVIKQDEVDQLRQEYYDMNKNHTPERDEFANAQSYRNPQGNFPFDTIRSHGDVTTWAIFSIVTNLENIRTDIGNQPMPVNSAYRTPKYNAAQPGSGTNSAHIYGLAADIDAERDYDGDGISDKNDWDFLSTAAHNKGACVEPYTATRRWVHMEWNGLPCDSGW